LSCSEQGRLSADGPASPPAGPPAPPIVRRWTIVDNPGIGRTIGGGYDGPMGQLTECEDPVTGYRFWVREVARPPGGWFHVHSNHRWGLKHGAAMPDDWNQFLELAVDPDIKHEWDRIAALVHDMDALHRPVQHNARFTKKTALWEFRKGWTTGKGE
jgi:hypothetical protein